MVNSSNLIIAVAALGAASTLAAPANINQQYAREPVEYDSRDVSRDLEQRGFGPVGLFVSAGKYVASRLGSGRKQRRNLEERGGFKNAGKALDLASQASQIYSTFRGRDSELEARGGFKKAGKALGLASQASEIYSTLHGRDSELEARGGFKKAGQVLELANHASNIYSNLHGRDFGLETRGGKAGGKTGGIARVKASGGRVGGGGSRVGGGGFEKASQVLGLASQASEIYSTVRGRDFDEDEMWTRELEEVYARSADEIDLD